MNKKLFLIKNIIFSINILLFICLICIGLCASQGFDMFLMYLFLVTMVIITIIDIYKKNKVVNNDKKYNIVFIISNLAIMLILIRGLFDINIISNIFNPLSNRYADTNKMSFIINNLTHINMIYFGLILYRLTFIKNIKK